MYAGLPRAVPVCFSVSPSREVSADPEIRHHRLALMQHHVVRLDVPVDHALGVGEAQGPQNLPDGRDGLIHRLPPFAIEPGAK
jgi:hypothetical protein